MVALSRRYLSFKLSNIVVKFRFADEVIPVFLSTTIFRRGIFVHQRTLASQRSPTAQVMKLEHPLEPLTHLVDEKGAINTPNGPEVPWQ